MKVAVAFLFGLAAGSMLLGQIQDPLASGKVRFSVIKAGTQSTIEEKQVLTFRSQGEWEQYWARSTGNPLGTAPGNFDWVNEKVVAFHLGTRPTGGYNIQVKDIYKKGIGHIIAEVVEYTPAPGTIVTQALTSPYVIVSIPNTGERMDVVWDRAETRPVDDSRRRRNERCSCSCDCCQRGYCDDERSRRGDRDRDWNRVGP